MSQSPVLTGVTLVASLIAGGLLLTQSLIAGAPARVPAPAEARASATRVANLVIGTIEHSMTDGDPLDTRALLERIERKVTDTDIDIYDHRGVEVYGAMPKVPHPREMNPGVVATLTDRQRRQGREGAWIYRPILGDESCATCHKDGATIRGVLAVEYGDCKGSNAGSVYGAMDKATRAQLKDELLASWEQIVAPIAGGDECRQAVEAYLEKAMAHSMRASQGRRATEILEAAASTDVIAQLALYDNQGRLYWKTQRSDPPPLVAQALEGVELEYESLATDEGARERVIVPILNQKRCVTCHGDADQVRGAVAVSVATPELAGAPAPILGGANRILSIIVGAMLLCLAGALVLRRRA